MHVTIYLLETMCIAAWVHASLVDGPSSVAGYKEVRGI